MTELIEVIKSLTWPAVVIVVVVVGFIVKIVQIFLEFVNGDQND